MHPPQNMIKVYYLYHNEITTLMNCLQIFADTETHDNGSILNLLSPYFKVYLIYDLSIFHIRNSVMLALRKYFRFFICWVEIKWRKLKEFLWEIIGDKWNKWNKRNKCAGGKWNQTLINLYLFPRWK